MLILNKNIDACPSIGIILTCLIKKGVTQLTKLVSYLPFLSDISPSSSSALTVNCPHILRQNTKNTEEKRLNLYHPHYIYYFIQQFSGFFLLLRLLNRWLLWFNAKANDCRRMGMGLVAGHRRSTLIAWSDDTESDVRECGNGPGCSAHRNRCGTMQNHEGTFDRLCNRSTHKHRKK